MADKSVVINILKQLQSNVTVLYFKLWSAHWNAVGKDFNDRHANLGSWKDSLGDILDEIAERLRQTDNPAVGSLQECLSMSKVQEFSSEFMTSDTFDSALLNDFTVLSNAYQAANDKMEQSSVKCLSTETMLGDHLRVIDKIKFFLFSLNK